MTEESLFRIISLALIMIVTGLGWYKIKLNKFKKDESEEKKIKQQAKKEGIKYAVVIGVIYMVIVLGISGLF